MCKNKKDSNNNEGKKCPCICILFCVVSISIIVIIALWAIFTWKVLFEFIENGQVYYIVNAFLYVATLLVLCFIFSKFFEVCKEYIKYDENKLFKENYLEKNLTENTNEANDITEKGKNKS